MTGTTRRETAGGAASAAPSVSRVTFTADYNESNSLGGEIGATCT